MSNTINPKKMVAELRDMQSQVLSNPNGFLDQVADYIEKLEKEVAGGEMPGDWVCEKCDFTYHKRVVAPSGIFAQTEPFNMICPNDGTLMKPMTYKHATEALMVMMKTQTSACEVCWTNSWAPAEEGDKDACQHKDGSWVVCQQCLQTEYAIARQNQIKELQQKHDKITEMVARFLVPHRTSIAETWKDAFVECGAVTIDKSYPYGFVAPVKLLPK
jgi:hypothetical protein